MIRAEELLSKVSLSSWRPVESEERVCISCAEAYPLTEFYSWRRQRKDGTVVAYSSYCKTCDDTHRNARKVKARMERAREMEKEIAELKAKIAGLERTGYFLRYLVLQGINAAQERKTGQWVKMARDSLNELDAEIGLDAEL